MTSSLIYWHGTGMVKCGNKNQPIFKGGLHVFAWQGADQCGAEKWVFFGRYDLHLHFF